MTAVSGIGWISGRECGGARKGGILRCENGDPTAVHKEVFSHPFKNFGRLDKSSRMTAVAVALALRDAGRSYAPERKQEIGIIGAGSEGSRRTDLDYFTDYLECGRTLARGNLFIYTLPSSPLGEAAIHFGLAGPLLFASCAGAQLPAAVTLAEEMLELKEAEAMLAGMVEGGDALYLVLSRTDQDGSQGGDPARRIAGRNAPLPELIREFRMLKEMKGM